MTIQKTIDAISKALLKRNETVSAAESVTAGNIQASLSLGDSAALYFQGGITAYNVVHKCDFLNVNLSDAISSNCVSEKVAGQMAVAACEMFSSSWSIACTGYATPFPPHTDDGLFAFYAIARNGKVLSARKITAHAKVAKRVQEEYTVTVLTAFLNLLRKHR